MTASARNLGVVLDEELKLAKHASSICISCYYQLLQLYHINRYFNFDSASVVVNSFTISRIDYCNSLVAATRRYQIHKLQWVQNLAAQLLLRRLSKFEHQPQTIVRNKPHWLHVPARITYKLNVVVLMAFNGTTLHYLTELLVLTTTNLYQRHLHLANCGFLLVPTRNLETRSKAFYIADLVSWNAIPDHLRDVFYLDFS